MSDTGGSAVPTSLAAVHAEAAQGLATAVQAAMDAPSGAPASETPAAAPTPATPTSEATPAPSQAAPAPQPETPSAPQQPAAAATPGQTASMDASSWSPESKRFLEMEGWDGVSPVTPDMVQRVATRALEFNNRLGTRGGATDPNADTRTTAPPAQAAPPADPSQQIAAQITQAQEADPECSQMVVEFQALDAALREIGNEQAGALGKAMADLAFAQRALELPDIKESPLRTDDIRNDIRSLGWDVSRLRAERAQAQIQVTDLERRYHDRATRIDSHIRGSIQRTAAINSRAAEMAKEWPTLIQRAATDAKIPTELHSKFFQTVKRDFVQAQRAGEEIPSLEAFMKERAAELVANLEQYHGLKSAEYGRLANQRTEAVTPSTTSVPGPAGATPAANNGPKSLEELNNNVLKELYATHGLTTR